MTLRRTLPIWYKLATPEERSKIDALDRSIAHLRHRRQALVNRAKLRTDVWVQHHGSPASKARHESAAG